MTLIEDASMEARCRQLVDGLSLPEPFSPRALADAVAAHSGGAVHLQALSADVPPEISGVVVCTPAGYLVQYPERADPWWAQVCLSHELAHILCGHVEDEGAALVETPPASPAAGSVDHLLPDLADAIAAWGGLYRCHMQQDQEREAELVASLLVQRIERSAAERVSVPSVAARTSRHEVVDRFADVLGDRRARRR